MALEDFNGNMSVSITYEEGYIDFKMNVPNSNLLIKLLYGALSDTEIPSAQRKKIAQAFVDAGRKVLEDVEIAENPYTLLYNKLNTNLT